MPTVSHIPPLPGFGLPLKHSSRDALFLSALDPELCQWQLESRMPALTLREIAMVQFMNEITDKCDWEHKVFDGTFTQRWKAEILQRPGADFTQEMADYCIEELRYTAELYGKTGFLKVYNGDVVKSDVAITTELQVALKAAIAPLENVPAHKRDWRPGSDEKVLDLVHPSLFPLVYGLSRILNNETIGLDDCISRCGRGEIIPGPSETSIEWRGMNGLYSRKFQWLPCDVDITGDTPKIVSYINHLHPQDHAGLYNIIEKIIEKVIPLWNTTLTPLYNLDFPRRIKYRDVKYGDLYDHPDRYGPRQLDGEDESEFWDRWLDWANLVQNEFLVYPNPPPFVRPEAQITGADRKNAALQADCKGRGEKVFDLKGDYGDTGLQVVVKLANIHLTPEKPEYDGGAWHAEGHLNEHICATAIYYYDNENITTGHLAFRQPSDATELERDIEYERSDYDWLEAIFGLRSEEPSVQVVGSVEAREGRVVTFPNLLQHQVQPFKLADPTKPGHRKILALFLVNPNIRIISTANIPCQRRDWWGRMVVSNSDVQARLPVELSDKIIEDVGDFPIGLKYAKLLREELMAESKALFDYQTKNFDGVAISLRGF